MRLPPSVKRRVELVARTLGPRADDPFVAASVVAVACAVFSSLYYGNMVLGYSWEVTHGDLGPLVYFVSLFVFTVANAFVVTWVVWWRLDFSGEWSYRDGAGGGLLVGLLSHATIGFVFVSVSSLTGGPSPPATSLGYLGTAVLVSVMSIPFTAGIPLLLSVGVAVALTYSRSRYGSDPGVGE